MNSCHLSVAVALLGAVLASPLAAEVPADDDVPLCRELMAGVRAQLPRDPLTLSGELIVRKRRGVIMHKCAFTIELEWGRQPPRARYTLRDLFGRDLEQLTVIRQPDGQAGLSYAAGHPLTAAPVPDGVNPIRRTDLTWTDLTLSFLWWTDGTVRGMEDVRGFTCYVVDMNAPRDRPGPYTHARLWIDRTSSVLLQAGGWAQDRLVRRLWVKSIKKIKTAGQTKERWMIKDMEIQSFPSHHRTKLRVQDVTEGPET